jgi:hypothetical protein
MGSSQLVVSKPNSQVRYETSSSETTFETTGPAFSAGGGRWWISAGDVSKTVVFETLSFSHSVRVYALLHQDLLAVRERGRVGGRPRALNGENLPQVQTLMCDPGVSTRQICEPFDISKATLSCYVGPGDERCR